MHEHLAAYHDAFDVIVIDAPSAIGCTLLNVLTASDLALLPVRCEPGAAKQLGQTLQIIQLVRTHTNPRLQRRIVVTMVDKRTRAARLTLEELHREFPDDVCARAIGTDVQTHMSRMLNPSGAEAPRGIRTAHQQYRLLADELLDVR